MYLFCNIEKWRNEAAVKQQLLGAFQGKICFCRRPQILVGVELLCLSPHQLLCVQIIFVLELQH